MGAALASAEAAVFASLVVLADLSCAELFHSLAATQTMVFAVTGRGRGTVPFVVALVTLSNL